VKLVLPYPVSANRYWVTFPYIDRETKKPKAVTVPSAEAKAYKLEVAWRAKVAGFKEPTDKPIEITSIQLCPRQNKDGSASAVVLDLGNCWKVVEDALQGVVYVNDKQIKRIRNVEYGPATKDGALVIEVAEFEPAAAPLFEERVAA
jgi:crossover junction endodeoxyribonuclease RusA